MARTTYGRYFFDENHCYVISNTGERYAEDITDKSFINPPIKMVVEATVSSLERTFDATNNPMNNPDLQDKLMSILHGGLPEWRLVGVNINSKGVYLVYDTECALAIIDEDVYSGGQVCVYGEYTLLFEIEHPDGLPTERYRVKVAKAPAISNSSKHVTQIQITEYTGERMSRMLEMRADNHGSLGYPVNSIAL